MELVEHQFYRQEYSEEQLIFIDQFRTNLKSVESDTEIQTAIFQFLCQTPNLHDFSWSLLDYIRQFFVYSDDAIKQILQICKLRYLPYYIRELAIKILIAKAPEIVDESGILVSILEDDTEDQFLQARVIDIYSGSAMPLPDRYNDAKRFLQMSPQIQRAILDNIHITTKSPLRIYDEVILSNKIDDVILTIAFRAYISLIHKKNDQKGHIETIITYLLNESNDDFVRIFILHEIDNNWISSLDLLEILLNANNSTIIRMEVAILLLPRLASDETILGEVEARLASFLEKVDDWLVINFRRELEEGLTV